MTRLSALVRALGRWVADHWTALGFDLRDAEFYGGLVLVGCAGGRWPIVGAVLALHAWIGPLLAARRS
jgi:hypothetical protein